MKTVLAGVTAADIDPHPFPHVVIDEAVSPETYRELAATMPVAETILHGREPENNEPFRLTGSEVLALPRCDAWHAFVRAHTSRDFFNDVLRVFGATIRALHAQLDALDTLRTSLRFGEPFADVALDCQITWGAPVTHSTRAHRVHVDRTVALYAGLLYMRLPEDDATGGDLELYRFRARPRIFEEGRYVDEARVELVKTIPYAANRLVFFIHSPDALHGVSARSATPHPRLHVNFLAEFREPVWNLAA